jgi:hypothetical protein
MSIKAFIKIIQISIIVAIITIVPLTNFFTYSSYANTTSSLTKKLIKPIAKKFQTIKLKFKKNAGRATGGSSTVLRQNLGTKTNYAAHHIIPVELKNHRVLNKIGMNMDEVNNGISLPKFPGVDPKLPLHRGSHPNYTNAVKKKLDEIPDNLSVKETKSRVMKIQREFRNKLEGGAPLHTSQGGVW